MKRILSLLFIILTMSVMVFSEEMPKEVKSPSDKLSLSSNNEMLYDGKLYTGKIMFNDVSYINLKDGHLEGEGYVKREIPETFFNVTNGKLEGEYRVRSNVNGKYNDAVIVFKNGEIQAAKINSDVMIFDSNGMANGIILSDGEEVTIKDGVGKSGNLILKYILNNEKDELVFQIFNKKNKLLSSSETSDFRFNRDHIEKMLFPSLFGKESDEARRIKEIEKESREELEKIRKKE